MIRVFLLMRQKPQPCLLSAFFEKAHRIRAQKALSMEEPSEVTRFFGNAFRFFMNPENADSLLSRIK